MEKNYNNISAGTETDRLIAEKVMGWTWDKYKRVYRINPNDNSLFGTGWGDDESPNGYFEPTTDIKAAWEVVEKMEDSNFCLDRNGDLCPSGLWQCIMRGSIANADTPSLAICRAALLAMQYSE